MDFEQLKAGDSIKYIGDSYAFGGYYKTYTAESTYINQDDCPNGLKGKLVIIELMNDGETPMFFPIHTLNSNEWEFAYKKIGGNEIE